jgi:hypothetical protein
MVVWRGRGCCAVYLFRNLRVREMMVPIATLPHFGYQHPYNLLWFAARDVSHSNSRVISSLQQRLKDDIANLICGLRGKMESGNPENDLFSFAEPYGCMFWLQCCCSGCDILWTLICVTTFMEERTFAIFSREHHCRYLQGHENLDLSCFDFDSAMGISVGLLVTLTIDFRCVLQSPSTAFMQTTVLFQTLQY